MILSRKLYPLIGNRDPQFGASWAVSECLTDIDADDGTASLMACDPFQLPDILLEFGK